MKLLIDANLSPRVAALLVGAGYAATHVGALGLLTATDDAIFDRAVADKFVIVTADSDFPMLLALRRATSPSVVHMRGVGDLAPEAHAVLLIANIPAIAEELERGAVASLSPTRLAVRDLPVR